MKAVILQYFGLGDNIFTIELCNRLIQDGYEIIYPVMPHFVEGLQRAYPHIKWVNYQEFPADYNCKEDKVINGLRHIPVRWSDGWNKTPYRDCMANKYKMFGLDWQIWRDGAMWQRDSMREDTLYQVATEFGNDYRLISDTFGSDFGNKVKIEKSGTIPNIAIEFYEGFSLFDWAKVIENATEIHVVSSSIIYLLEMLDLRAKEVHLYQRSIAGQGFDTVDYILQRHKYIFHK